jgi:lipoprotein-anchoring transpeptidase ErfK/SrfK
MSRYRLVRRGHITVVVSVIGVLAATIGAVFAVPALAATPAQIAASTSTIVAGTPCTAAAHACVDLTSKKAWLIKNGKIYRGPVPIASGARGKPTPLGDVFRVYRKDQAHTTAEFKLPNGKPAPMPYSVFFADGGIAFHAGNPNQASAGCVHLNLADAKAFYAYLQIGDHVQVKRGPLTRRTPPVTKK